MMCSLLTASLWIFCVQTKELLEFYFGDSNLFKDGFRV
jgi:hypothetical protein